MAGKPVPHADFAGDVEKEEGSEQEEQRAAEDGAGVGKDKACGAGGRRHAGDGVNDKRNDGERRDGVAEANPVALEEIGGDEGRGQSAEAEEEIEKVERGGAVLRLTPLTSALAPVTTMPPPMPSRNRRKTMLRKPGSAAGRRARWR